MKNIKTLILAFAVMLTGALPAYSQWSEEEIDAMTRITVAVDEPVYAPVLGVGIGYFNFYGNVNDGFRSHTVGKPGVRINLATYLDKKKHFFRGNFYFMTGELSGTQRTITGANTDTSRYNNLNFKSNIFSFGANVHWSFKPWVRGRFFEPFISAGIEAINFDSKADYGHGDNNSRYHYWPDGTIRDNAWDELDPKGNIISRDYDYDFNLRKENQSGLGAYSQFTLAIPVDIGIDFNVSKRVTLRAATSLHYTFTDLIDDLSAKANKDPNYKGKGGNNMYTYSYVSLHVDLFSPPREITKELDFLSLNADDYDFTMSDDQDDDGILDRVDQCPDTPPTVLKVDSVGCPFDTDGDGVPDYLDREPNSRSGAIVDEYGVEINENMVVEVLNAQAIRRSDVESYLRMHRMQNKARRGESLPIPDKFKRSDGNKDGYISFDELLKSINDFFDDISPYSPTDINELIDFFFEQ